MSGKNREAKRTVTCSFCGREHRRNSKELRECRRNARRGKEPAADTSAGANGAPRRQGAPSTRYEVDPLRGDKRAHAIAKKLRQGWPARKIAKHLNVPVETVYAVRDRAGL